MDCTERESQGTNFFCSVRPLKTSKQTPFLSLFFGSGIGKKSGFGIQNNHPGSATLRNSQPVNSLDKKKLSGHKGPQPCFLNYKFHQFEDSESNSNGAVPLTGALITVTDLDVWKKLGFHRESLASFVFGLIHPSERSERILTV